MSMMISYDCCGPIVNIRNEQFWTRIDPLGFRDNFRYEFELEIADHIETESCAEVFANRHLLKKGCRFNDYYGFGTSRKSAIEEAETFQRELSPANIDVIVTTIVKTTAVFFDPKKEPFYSGAVRCFHIPSSWMREPGKKRISEIDFEIFHNGKSGKDAAELEAIINQMKQADAAGDRRKGALR